MINAVVNRDILDRCHSVADRNVMFLTRRYDRSLEWLNDFLLGRLPLLNADFLASYYSALQGSSVLRSVCPFVCLSTTIKSLEPLDRSHDFLCRSYVAVVQFSSGGVAIAVRSLMSMNALFVNCFEWRT